MVLDRSGVTGPDGASHNGMWDLSMLGIVPGMRVAAPRDAARLREELGEALDVNDGPTALRFPKGDVGEDIPALERRDGVDVLAVPADGLSDDVLLVAVGPFASMALAVAERLRNQGIGVTVVDPRWVLPVPEAIGELATGAQAGGHAWRTTVLHGGVGSAVSAALRRAEIDVPCRDVGLPQEFLAHASRGEVLADVGLTDQQHRPPDHRLGGRAGQRRLRARGQPPARLSETRPASSNVVDLRGCSKNTSALRPLISTVAMVFPNSGPQTSVHVSGGEGTPRRRTHHR